MYHAQYGLHVNDCLYKAGGFETPADSGTLTNFVEMGQARDKILSLKLDQVCPNSFLFCIA